ncbi:hypothetical protein SALLE_v1c09700 [Spiroplasma alleghenense]|uniref:Uncharacterized protein n=1 Tax=Spiroplasma alleghenense TaxID=216931 RepID=A0A345Z4W1_9MOLU|nr:hypothetical protein SALLE_v1c09700 [Spiroplasma alleghenense]
MKLKDKDLAKYNLAAQLYLDFNKEEDIKQISDQIALLETQAKLAKQTYDENIVKVLVEVDGLISACLLINPDYLNYTELKNGYCNCLNSIEINYNLCDKLPFNLTKTKKKSKESSNEKIKQTIS